MIDKFKPFWDSLPFIVKVIIAPLLLIGLVLYLFVGLITVPYFIMDEMVHPEKYDSLMD